MAAERDPVSVLFDAAARQLLSRAYARAPAWVMTRLRDPEARHYAELGARGIDPSGPDPVAVLPGRGVNARDRWTRGFIRALYYQHRNYSGKPGGWGTRRNEPRHAVALQVEVGRRKPATGVFPAGRAIRVRALPDGARALAAVRRLPDDARVFTDAGDQAARAVSGADARDWGQ